MGLPIPFDLTAANVPRAIDLMDIAAGDPTNVAVYANDFDPSDVVLSMFFAAKRNLTDADSEITSIIKTITTSPTAAGVLVKLADGVTWLGTFQLTLVDTVRLARLVNMYGVRATVQRGSTTYTRIIQTGYIHAIESVTEDASPLADGQWFADGSIYANGFEIDP